MCGGGRLYEGDLHGSIVPVWEDDVLFTRATVWKYISAYTEIRTLTCTALIKGFKRPILNFFMQSHK